MRHARAILLFSLIVLLHVAASHAQRPDAPLYALHGPYAVGTQDFTVEDSQRSLNVTVWYPALNAEEQEQATTYRSGLLTVSGRALRNASPSSQDAPYPLVVFSHGSGGFRFQSLFFTEHLASYGFVVVAADHPGNTVLDALQPVQFARSIVPSYAYRPADVLREIAFAETLNAPGGPLDAIIDLERIAVTGHSFGGYTALAVGGAQVNFDALEQWCDDAQGREDAFDPDRMSYTVCFMRGSAAVVAKARGLDSPPQGVWPAVTDSRVKAVVAMAPWNGPIFGGGGLDHVAVPVMILVGSADSVTPPERDAYAIYNQIASEERALVTFENADHYIFVDSCWELAIRLGFFDRCSDQIWDMARAHDLTNHFATSFLLSALYGDPAARQALAPDAVDFRGVKYIASE